jgi:hypothetical protein
MYTFRTTTGAVCCSGADIRHLCDTCKARAQTVEPPVGLLAGVQSRQTADPRSRLAEHFPTSRPVTAVSEKPVVAGSVPAAPSLIATLKEKRA